jgi:hypothetical protein
MNNTTTPPKRTGRPPLAEGAPRKRNRGISLTDGEYDKLLKLAEAQKLGVSQFLVRSHNLDT